VRSSEPWLIRPPNRSAARNSMPEPSRPGVFHPEPLTDPDVNLSIHPARATQRKAAAFHQDKEIIRLPVVSSQCGWPAPFAPRHFPPFVPPTEQSAPFRFLGFFGLMVLSFCPFPLTIPAPVLKFRPQP